MERKWLLSPFAQEGQYIIAVPLGGMHTSQLGLGVNYRGDLEGWRLVCWDGEVSGRHWGSPALKVHWGQTVEAVGSRLGFVGSGETLEILKGGVAESEPCHLVDNEGWTWRGDTDEWKAG